MARTGRPSLATDVKQRRGTYRPGRDNPNLSGMCEHANRRLQVARKLLPPDAYEVYAEAIHRIEFRTPHCQDGTHGFPTLDGLDDIELCEGAVDAMLTAYGADDATRRALSLRASDLYRLILDQQSRAA